MKPLLVSLAACASLLGANPQSPQWPQFRGSGARGISENPRLPERWSVSENVEWRIDVPGRGWSSPIVSGNRIFLTTATSQGPMEDPRKELFSSGGERRVPSKGPHQWLLLCYDLLTGREIWRREAHSGTPAHPLHVKNSYASETPVTDGERIYAYFGNVGLFCYDLDGKALWKTNWPTVKTEHDWGTAASPVLHNDRLFIVNDNESASYIMALDAKTGRQLWRKERDEKSNWATPFVWQNPKRIEIVTSGSKKVRSYDLDGNLLWELAPMSAIVIPTPFEADGLLYVCAGYIGDPRRPVYTVRPGASGDISLPEGKTSSEFIAWHHPAAAPYNPSPLVYKGNFYILFDSGFLGCYDARTGREFYAKERIRPEGQTAFTASPWAYKDRIFALSEDGDTYVFQAGPEYKFLHKNSLDEMCLATPAIAGDRLLIRSLTKLNCIRQK